ncbi:extracellular solute-binding protein [Fodinisporobacter ferrooxydans]|uniref:Extracellular solute-binding protein n=1 Tax=Fodinisporobacter ferrooxydans TaxID=2901836 RepID=A0ABY4CL75_9BACL|nr:extracellular solute-binding protein [Alicyclobacillaceae bacterium MYW30-H2]
MNKSRYFQVSLCVSLMGLLLTACTPFQHVHDGQEQNPTSRLNPNKQVDAPFPGWVAGLPKIQAPKGFNWRQFAGTHLRFISEITPPSSALRANIKEFENVTGIDVTIEQMDLESVVEKVGLEFHAHADTHQVIYADPYQVLAEYSNQFVDLNRLNHDPALPHIPGGVHDFISTQLAVDGYMGSDQNLYTLPYDSPTMIMAYRKDIFDKYKSLFLREEGFDWTPGPNLTWEQYYTIAKWINEKVKQGIITEVKYGTGEQAKQYDSLMCDFSNILAAYGGDYFHNPNMGYVGTFHPGPSALQSQNAIRAATFYQKLMQVADPYSISWDWQDLADAFAGGDLAMAPMWHEYSAMFENPKTSRVVGKVGWSLLPRGPVRSANIFGGTGIGINKYATPNEQKAAWLFLIWATSPQTEYEILQSKAGGETPTRHSVYNLEAVRKGMEPGTAESGLMPNLLPMKATLDAWKKQYLYTRPKIPNWTEIDTVIFTELEKMIANKETPAQAMNRIAQKTNQVTGEHL